VRIKGKASFQPTVYISGIKVKDKEGLDNTVSRRVLNHRGEPLAIGEENLIRKIFSDLVSDKKLEEYVNFYNSAQEEISKNKGFKEYNSAIKNMWNGI
jgi:hypothetical protein